MSNGPGTVGALKITLGLESLKFDQGMKTANQRLTALNSEFKAISAGAAKFDNSLEALRARTDVLTRKMDVHKAKVEELRKQYEASKATKGEDAAETVELATTYNRAVAAMKSTEQQLQNMNRRIREQTDGFKLLEREVTLSTNNIDRQMHVLESGFAAATAGIEDFGSETEELRQREQHLSQALELQQRKIQELTRLHEEAARTKGADARETQEIEIRLNQATQAMRATERQLNNTTQEIEQQSNAWNALSRKIDETSATLQERGATFQNVGMGLTAAVTLPLTGFAVLAGKAANDFDSSSGRIEARLGVTKERAKELSEVAQDVWRNGFGEGVREASDTVTLVRNNLKGLSDNELKEATQAAFFLSEAFNSDVNESTRAAGQLMKDFGDSSSKAFDLITWGFQNGLDYTGEFLDTIREYSPQFAEMGYSSEQMLNTMKAGFDAGAWSLDKIGDSIKESHLRMSEMSKSTVDAYKALGFSAETYTRKIAKGGAEGNKAFQEIIAKLMTVKDAQERNALSVALFGTQYEDLREKVIFSMAGASKSINGLEGTTKRATDAIQNNFGTRLQKVWRNFQKDLEPIGEDLLDIAEDTLPKLAKSLEKATDAFTDMSPEGQKIVLVLGGIVAAAGPVMMGVGALTSGIGLLTKGVAPLVASLGTGAGLAGTLALLSNPITLTVAGLGLAAGATYLAVKATEKAKEVNLDHAKSLLEQHKSIEGLTARYEELRNKNKLSNDELLEFKDIQDKMKTAGSAKEVELLSKQADTLREKSGLSNDELSEMLKLNDRLIKEVPTANKVISEQGNAVIGNVEDIQKKNDALRENLVLELEIQKAKADAKLDDTINKQIHAIEEYQKKVAEVKEEEAERDAKIVELEALKAEQQKQYLAGNDMIADAMNIQIQQLSQEIIKRNDNIEKLAEEAEEKGKSVEKSKEELAKVQQIYAELINLQLAQAGINATGAEGIAQLDEAIAKTQTRINDLNLIKEKHGSLNAEQQKELETLTSALGIYTSTKGEIQNIQGEQAAVNEKIDQATGKAQDLTEELGKDVDKDVNVDDKGKAKKITDEAGKGASKDVNVTDQGKASSIHAEAEKAASKGITLFLENTIMSLLPTSVSIPVKLIGKLTGMFAKGTKSAPGGLSLVGEEGPELIHLPKGAKVIPNKDTETILRNWNIPMMATGGIALTDGMAYVGERGRELLDMSGAVTSPLPNGTAVSSSHGNTYDVKVYSQQVVMDENELSRTLQRLEALYG